MWQQQQEEQERMLRLLLPPLLRHLGKLRGRLPKA